MISLATLLKLKELDTPTVSNAIERFDVRPRTEGYAGFDLRCVYPALASTVGFAVTCTADSLDEGPKSYDGLFALWEAVASSPKPAVLVIKDVSRNSKRSCHLGEVMAATAKALGAIGCISDGGIRDIREIERLGEFQLFCPGFVASHGNPRICDVGATVDISGLRVNSGDLLHCDLNGIIQVPVDIAADVIAEAERVKLRERRILGFVGSVEFDLAALRKLMYRNRE